MSKNRTVNPNKYANNVTTPIIRAVSYTHLTLPTN